MWAYLDADAVGHRIPAPRPQDNMNMSINFANNIRVCKYINSEYVLPLLSMPILDNKNENHKGADVRIGKKRQCQYSRGYYVIIYVNVNLRVGVLRLNTLRI